MMSLSRYRSKDNGLFIGLSEGLNVTPDVVRGFKLLSEIYKEHYKVLWPFSKPVNAGALGLHDYLDVVKTPMDLKTINDKFAAGCYSSITSVVADVRQMIENCYRYNGADHELSKLALKLETVLEQKIALLPRDVQEKVTLYATNVAQGRGYLNDLYMESSGSSRRRRTSFAGGASSSPILGQLQFADAYREKEEKRVREEERKADEERLSRELIEWDKIVLTPELLHDLRTCWEVVSVGMFIYILKDFFHLGDLNYTEFELGVLFMDKSSLMSKIMTRLLLPTGKRNRPVLRSQMSYRAWSMKLSQVVANWFRVAAVHGWESASISFGFDPTIFKALGYENPLAKGVKFMDLSLRQRLAVIKALCEAVSADDESLSDHIAHVSSVDRLDIVLGFDSEKRSYHYLPLFGATDIRIFRQGKAKKGYCHTSERSPGPDFQLVAWDVASLRDLSSSFRRGKQLGRKSAETELQETLQALVDELESQEPVFCKSMHLAKIKVMQECRKESDEEAFVKDDLLLTHELLESADEQVDRSSEECTDGESDGEGKDLDSQSELSTVFERKDSRDCLASMLAPSFSADSSDCYSSDYSQDSFRDNDETPTRVLAKRQRSAQARELRYKLRQEKFSLRKSAIAAVAAHSVKSVPSLSGDRLAFSPDAQRTDLSLTSARAYENIASEQVSSTQLAPLVQNWTPCSLDNTSSRKKLSDLASDAINDSLPSNGHLEELMMPTTPRSTIQGKLVGSSMPSCDVPGHAWEEPCFSVSEVPSLTELERVSPVRPACSSSTLTCRQYLSPTLSQPTASRDSSTFL